jgi:ficolin
VLKALIMVAHVLKAVLLAQLFICAQGESGDMDKIFEMLQRMSRDIAHVMELVITMQGELKSHVDAKCSELASITELVNRQQESIDNIETLVQKEMCVEYEFPRHDVGLFCRTRAQGIHDLTVRFGDGCGDREKIFQVYCAQSPSPGGWIVLLRRIDDAEDFPKRLWEDYKDGFGNLNGSFWLGLELMHQMTSKRPAVLRVELEDFEGESRYAEYEHFMVASEEEGYRLGVGEYRGNAGDSLGYHNGMKFSTVDKEQDASKDHHCAKDWDGAWWYNDCKRSQLTGYYYEGKHNHRYKGIAWYDWRGDKYSYKRAEMKIRWK